MCPSSTNHFSDEYESRRRAVGTWIRWRRVAASPRSRREYSVGPARADSKITVYHSETRASSEGESQTHKGTPRHLARRGLIGDDERLGLGVDFGVRHGYFFYLGAFRVPRESESRRPARGVRRPVPFADPFADPSAVPRRRREVLWAGPLLGWRIDVLAAAIGRRSAIVCKCISSRVSFTQ